MENKMLSIVEKELRVGSFVLSQGFNVEHRALRKLVIKYKKEFEELGVITSAMQKPEGKKGGRPIDEFMLNEEQAMFIGTLLTNNEVVRRFKLKLVKEFTKMRKNIALLMVDKKNQEYIEARQKGIEMRKEETGMIKKFVEYAIAQGSESAKFYYSNITKMQNSALFILQDKFPNLREVLNYHQLSLLRNADHVICKWLEEGMNKGLHYKEIYQLAKEKVILFAEVVGKTNVPIPVQENKLLSE